MSDDTTGKERRNFVFRGTPEIFVSVTLAQWHISGADFQAWEIKNSGYNAYAMYQLWGDKRQTPPPSPKRDPTHTTIAFKRGDAYGRIDAYARPDNTSIVVCRKSHPAPDSINEYWEWLISALAAYIDTAPSSEIPKMTAGDTASGTQYEDQAGATSEFPKSDQAGGPAGDETLPGLIDKELEDWYRWLLKCKPQYSNGDMSWEEIGRRFSVGGKTAKRRLAELQERNLPGLEDWPKRAN